MEEILSSIKRIIAEEGDTPQRPRRAARSAASTPAMVASDAEDDEVLELSDPMPLNRAVPDPQPAPPEPRAARATAASAATVPERIVSPEAAAASRGALDMLSRLMVKPEQGSDGSLEGLVREMLRPMLRDWLDANLPELVEAMVAREIKRITGSAG